jgi:hypothetical protein
MLVLGRNDIVLLLSALVFNLNHGIYLYFFYDFLKINCRLKLFQN